MFCIKNKLNFTVCRCIYSAFCWCHHCTVTHHFSCKSFIRCSRKICCDSVYRAVNDCRFSDLFFFYRCQGLCCTCIFVLNLCTVLSICISCCSIFLYLYIIRCLIREFVGSSLQIFFQLRLDNSYMRSIDNLYALSFFYDSSGICLFQKFIADSLRLCNCDTKSGRTTVNIYDIFLSAKASGDQFTYRITGGCCSCTGCLSGFFSCIYISFCIKLCLCIIIFTSRSLEIKFPDHKCKDYIIQDKVNNTNRNDPQPACFCISLQDTKEEQVKETS